MKALDNIGCPPPSVPSQAINSFPFPPYTLWKSLLTSQNFSPLLSHSLTHLSLSLALSLAHTQRQLNTPKWWQFLNHMAIHTHMCKLPPHAHNEIFTHPTHPLLRVTASTLSTTTHSSANELISWFHSFHCCHTPSISPFLPSLKTSRGAQRPGGEEGAWNIQAVQRLLISYPLWFPRNMGFWWCAPVWMYVCDMKEIGEGLKMIK